MAPLSSQAAALLLQVTASGVELRRCGDELRFRPPRIADDLLRQLQAVKPAILALLDDGVQARIAAFKQQLASTPAPGIPSFLFKVGVPYQEGFCFSCGDPLLVLRYGRCWKCSLAWRLAAKVSTVDDTSFDEAKVI